MGVLGRGGDVGDGGAEEGGTAAGGAETLVGVLAEPGGEGETSVRARLLTSRKSEGRRKEEKERYALEASVTPQNPRPHVLNLLSSATQHVQPHLQRDILHRVITRDDRRLHDRPRSGRRSRCHRRGSSRGRSGRIGGGKETKVTDLVLDDVVGRDPGPAGSVGLGVGNVVFVFDEDSVGGRGDGGDVGRGDGGSGFDGGSVGRVGVGCGCGRVGGGGKNGGRESRGRGGVLVRRLLRDRKLLDTLRKLLSILSLLYRLLCSLLSSLLLALLLLLLRRSRQDLPWMVPDTPATVLLQLEGKAEGEDADIGSREDGDITGLASKGGDCSKRRSADVEEGEGEIGRTLGNGFSSRLTNLETIDRPGKLSRLDARLDGVGGEVRLGLLDDVAMPLVAPVGS